MKCEDLTPSFRARTQAHVIEAFLGTKVEMDMVRPDQWTVAVKT